MSSINDLVGYLDQAHADPLGTTQSFLPRRRNELPHARYGRRGLYVVLTPIKGLTPAGVFPGNKPFAFQCPPMNEFGESGSFNHQDYDTLSEGQQSQPIGKQLRTVSFDTLFVDWEPEWSLAHDGSGVYPAQAAIKELCALRDHGKPFHLVAHQSNFQEKYEVDYAATLRSVNWKIVAGETDAYYVTVQFSEFSTPDIQEFLSGSKTHPHLPASLVVATLRSDRNTLAKMAKIYYGDPSKWRVIAARNGLTKVAPNTVLTSRNTRATRVTVPVLPKKKKSR